MAIFRPRAQAVISLRKRVRKNLRSLRNRGQCAGNLGNERDDQPAIQHYFGGYREMSSSRTGFFAAVTLAGLAVSLILAGCGPQPGTGPAAAASPGVTISDTTAPTPAATATAISPASPEAPAPAATPVPEAPAPPVVPAAPALKTYTFPDGHVSFTHPASWTVRTKVAGSVPGVEAFVSDGTGNELVRLAYGFITGCASGPTSRVLFDSAPVPGIPATGGSTPTFGFAVDTHFGKEQYNMGLTDPRYLEQGEGVTSTCQLVPTGQGGLQTSVLFNDPGFPDAAAAKAWMATQQYAQLKALVTSLTYS
jgi:hypothetical protein